MPIEESLLDGDRLLALEHVSGSARAALESLWRLDATLGAQLTGASEPAIAQIRLVWWRDALAQLRDGPPPAEPVLQSVAGDILPAGITAIEVSGMTEAWENLLGSDQPTHGELAEYAGLRGGALFRMSARLLQSPATDKIALAGEGWALVDLARRSSARAEQELAFALASDRLRRAPRRWPRRLRSLGMLVALARRDVARGAGRIEPAGVPPRVLRMHWHRLTGV